MPRPELLETFDNPYADRDYEIHMDCSEFTSLCPLGGIESDAEELALLKGGSARLRNDPYYLRSGGQVHRAQESQAVSLELQERWDLLRASRQPDSR